MTFLAVVVIVSRTGIATVKKIVVLNSNHSKVPQIDFQRIAPAER